MGIPFIDPNNKKGKYIEPKEWNDLISKDDVIVIDTRNFYETSIGKFTNSIIPETKTFRDFPQWADNFAKNKINKTKKNKLSVKSEIKIDNTNKKSLKVNKNIYEVVDVCTIIEKCSIEEISKYLIDQGNERDYPDITIKERKL